MAKEVALMNKDKVIAYLEYYPQIDGEIAERRHNRNELDMAYAPAGAIQYDGMPKGKNHISRPTEDLLLTCRISKEKRQKLYREYREVTTTESGNTARGITTGIETENGCILVLFLRA